MGQSESVPAQSFHSLISEYKKLHLQYDEVQDELFDLYSDYDATRAALMNKHRTMSELGSRFDRDERVKNEMTEEDAKTLAARKKKYGGSDSDTGENLEALRKKVEEEKKWCQLEREKLDRLISQYRNHAYDSTNDPEELKTHLVFNEAQYGALRQYDDDLMNEKESLIVSLKKGAAQKAENDVLIAENSENRRKLEEEMRKYEVMESGYKAVKQYLEDGSGFRGSNDLERQIDQLRNELDQALGDREYYLMIVNDYTPLQEEFQRQRRQLDILESQGNGVTDQSRRIVELEDQIASQTEEKDRIETTLNSELRSYREMTKQVLFTAQQKSEKLQEENEEMKEELKLYKTDIDIDDVTVEQQAIVRVALQKQAKVYRQREKELQKHIQELEEEAIEPVDVSAVIDEALREVMKRASEIQMRQKLEIAALRDRIRELQPEDADDHLENINDIVQEGMDNTDQDLLNMMQEIETLRGKTLIIERMNEKMTNDRINDKDRNTELNYVCKQQGEELNENSKVIQQLEAKLSGMSNHGGIMNGLLEKYARMCGVSDEDLHHILFDLGCDDVEQIEVYNETNSIYDARIKGVVHHIPQQDIITQSIREETVPRLMNDMGELNEKVFHYQRLVKKLTFENKRMQAIMEQNDLDSSNGLSSFEMVELDKLHDQFWSDKSDLIEEITDLRKENALIRDQIDHLPTEARLYRESLMRTQGSMEQDDDLTELPRYGPSRRVSGVNTVYRASVSDGELEKRNRELSQRLDTTRKELHDANDEFRKLCESMKHLGGGNSDLEELTMTVHTLTEMKDKLEKENKTKESEIDEARSIVAQKEKQLEEKRVEAQNAYQLAEKRSKDYEAARKSVHVKEDEIDGLMRQLKEKEEECEQMRSKSDSGSSDSDREEELYDMKKELKEKEKELEQLRKERDNATVAATTSQAELSKKLQEVENENEKLREEMKEMKEKLNELENEMNEMKGEMQLLESELTIADGSTKDFTKKKEEAEKRREEAEKGREEAEKEVKEMKKEMKEMKKALDEARRKTPVVAAIAVTDAIGDDKEIEELKKKLKKKKETVKEEKEKREAAEKEVEAAVKGKEEADQKKVEIEKEIEELKKELEENNRKAIIAAAAALALATANQENLKKELKEKEKEMKEMKEMKEEAEMKVVELKKELEEAEKAQREITSRVDDEKAIMQTEEKDDEVSNLRQLLAEKSEELQRTSDDLNDTKGVMEEKEEELKEAVKQKEEAEQKLEKQKKEAEEVLVAAVAGADAKIVLIQKELDEMKQMMMEAEKKAEKLKEELEKAEKKKEEAEKNVDKLEKELEESEKKKVDDIDALKEEIEQAKKEKEEMDKTATAATAALVTVTASAATDLKEAKKEVKEAKKKADEAKKEMIEAEKKIDDLETKLKESDESKGKDDDEKLKDAKAEVKSLKKELKSTKKNAAAAAAAAVIVAKELSDAKEEVEKVNEELDQLKKDMKEKEFDASPASKMDADKKVGELEDKINQADQKIMDLEAKLKKADEAKEETKIQLEEAEKKVEESEKKKVDDIDALKEEIEQAKKEKEEMDKTATAATAALVTVTASAATDLKEAKKEVKEAKKKADEAKKEMIEAEKKIDDLETKLKESESLQKSLDDAKKEAEDVKNDIESLRNDLDDKNADLESVRSQMEKKEKELAKVNEELEKVKKNAEKTKQELEKEKEDKETLKAKMEKAEIDLDQLKKELEDAKKRVDMMLEDAEEKNNDLEAARAACIKAEDSKEEAIAHAAEEVKIAERKASENEEAKKRIIELEKEVKAGKKIEKSRHKEVEELTRLLAETESKSVNEDDLNALKTKLEEAEKKLEAEKMKMNDAVEEKQNAMRIQSVMENEVKEAEEKVKELQKEKDLKEKEAANAEKKVKDLEIELEGAKSMAVQSKNELDKIKVELDSKATEIISLKEDFDSKVAELISLKKELDELKKEKKDVSEKKESNPDDSSRLKEFETMVEEKKARIEELEKCLSEEGRLVLREDEELKEMKYEYEKRMELLNASGSSENASQLMKKRMMADMQKSKKNEIKMQEMRMKEKENVFMITQKEKEVLSLQKKIQEMDLEHQKIVCDLKLKSNKEVDDSYKLIATLRDEIAELKETIIN